MAQTRCNRRLEAISKIHLVRTLSHIFQRWTSAQEGKSNQMRKWTLLGLAITTTPILWTLTRNPKVWPSMGLWMSGFISRYALVRSSPSLCRKIPRMSISSSALQTIRVVALSEQSQLRCIIGKPQASPTEMLNKNRRFLKPFQSAKCQSWCTTKAEISSEIPTIKHRDYATLTLLLTAKVSYLQATKHILIPIHARFSISEEVKTNQCKWSSAVMTRKVKFD